MDTIAHRNKYLASIHILKKDLGLSDDQYRRLLVCFSGVRSCSGLDDQALSGLLKKFKDFRVDYDERAGIIEFCGCVSRERAEIQARDDSINMYERIYDSQRIS